MIAPQTSSLKAPALEDLRELAGSSGFCLTALISPFAPGEKTRFSPAALLRNYTHEAEIRLTALGANKEQISTLLQPLTNLAGDPALMEGFHWSRAMLRSPEIFAEFLLRKPVEGGMTVGERFNLLALVAEAEMPREFYVLKLSKRAVSLARVGSRLEAVKIPRTAATLDEFLELDKPDHDRENRTGAAPRVRFGTGTERENHMAYLGAYYKHADQELSTVLRPKKAMVVLAGVEEDTALFRSVATYPYVLAESIQRSPDDGSSEEDLLQRAFLMMRQCMLKRNAAALKEARERMAPGRFSEDAAGMAQMAEQGRVGQLYVAEDAKEEKLNRVLIETLAHGGEVHALPAGRAAAAVMRY